MFLLHLGSANIVLSVEMVLGLLDCVLKSLLVLGLHLEHLVVELLLQFGAALVRMVPLLFHNLVCLTETGVKLLNFKVKLLLHIS
jgi:hypothetical protein